MSQGTEAFATHLIARKSMLLDQENIPSATRQHHRRDTSSGACANDDCVGHIFMVAGVCSPCLLPTFSPGSGEYLASCSRAAANSCSDNPQFRSALKIFFKLHAQCSDNNS